MAEASSFAQHCIECENCEENPAKFLCKTCMGHLCESCKSEHGKRKISKNHDIIHLTSEMGYIMELWYCSIHATKKLECYCSPCQTPVCTQCMTGTHNGHKVKDLAKVYSQISDELQNEKKEIEATLLPKYLELLAKENEKKAAISERTDEVQSQIEDHAKNIIKEFITIQEKRVQELRQEEEKALKSVDNSKTEIERRIKTLNEIKDQISNNLGEKPGIVFFNALTGNIIAKMRQYPDSNEYELDTFSPGDIEGKIQDIDFGNVPNFLIKGAPVQDCITKKKKLLVGQPRMKISR